MIGKLIVPLDGSPMAERAVGLADGLAEAADLPVVLFASRWDLDTQHAEGYLAAQAGGMRHRDVRCRVMLDETAPVAIARELEMIPDSMAVMSSHGRSGVGQAVLGSVTEEVLRASGTPVMVIGPHWAGGNVDKGSSLVMAVDGEVSAESLLPPVVELARALHLHVWIVEVRAASRANVSLAQESTVVHRVAKRLQDADVSADWEVLHGDEPAAEILDFADRHNVSVLALTTRVRQGVKRVALGSVAMRVVRNARQPVLLTRAEQPNIEV